MAVHLYRHQISYFCVPKCACTSLKHFFFEIENGFEFQEYRANGEHKHIHNACYPTRSFERKKNPRMEGHWKATVVREPVARLLSCYSNRVVHHQELSGIDLSDEDRERGVVRNPDLPTFIRFLQRYRLLSPSIKHHSERLGFFLGDDADYYDRIYKMSEVGKFAEEVRARTGASCELGRLQTGGPKIDRAEVPADLVTKVENFYEEDYERFGKFF